MKDKCFWGHCWGLWVKKEWGNIENDHGKVGDYFIQERTCLDCNYIEIDRQNTRITD